MVGNGSCNEELHHFHLLILAAAIKAGLDYGLDYEEMRLMD